VNGEFKSTLRKNDLKKVFSRSPVDFAYLFGSYALRTANHRSDVDIAVFFDGTVSKSERFEYRLKLMGAFSRLFKKEVEVVILNDTSSLFFKYAIIKEGNLLYEKSEAARVEFERKLLSEFFDFQPFLDAYNRQYVQTRL
jgi:predicted nucleotidyltransferase